MFTKAKPTRVQISQISRVSTHSLPRTSSVLLFNWPSRLLSTTRLLSSNPVVSGVTVDQTKQDNHPDGDKKGEHEYTASSARTEVGRNQPAEHDDTESKPKTDTDSNHPAKQPDPQKTPERATGIETQGPDERTAGDGKDTGGVHKEQGKPGPHQTWEGDGKPAT